MCPRPLDDGDAGLKIDRSTEKSGGARRDRTADLLLCFFVFSFFFFFFFFFFFSFLFFRFFFVSFWRSWCVSFVLWRFVWFLRVRVLRRVCRLRVVRVSAFFAAPPSCLLVCVLLAGASCARSSASVCRCSWSWSLQLVWLRWLRCSFVLSALRVCRDLLVSLSRRRGLARVCASVRFVRSWSRTRCVALGRWRFGCFVSLAGVGWRRVVRWSGGCALLFSLFACRRGFSVLLVLAVVSVFSGSFARWSLCFVCSRFVAWLVFAAVRALAWLSSLACWLAFCAAVCAFGCCLSALASPLLLAVLVLAALRCLGSRSAQRGFACAPLCVLSLRFPVRLSAAPCVCAAARLFGAVLGLCCAGSARLSLLGVSLAFMRVFRRPLSRAAPSFGRWLGFSSFILVGFLAAAARCVGVLVFLPDACCSGRFFRVCWLDFRGRHSD